jgi:hypothetical protein
LLMFESYHQLSCLPVGHCIRVAILIEQLSTANA